MLLVLGGLGVLLLRASRTSDPLAREGVRAPAEGPARTEDPPAAPAGSAVGVPAAPLAPVEPRETARRPDAAPEPGLAGRGQRDPALFEGRGTLRGHVEIYGELSAPDAWTLVLRPSQTLFGSEHAEAREIPHRGDQLDFVVEDLPLGGYDVQAVAPGRNGLVLPVLLTRKNRSPFVVIGISPASYLEGYVVDGEAVGVEGIDLVLESPDGSSRVQTASDATGYWRFEEVRDGAYRLLVGPPGHPLLPAESLRLSAPGMRFPTIELPPLGTLDVFVVDPDGIHLPGARVRGSGTRGGVLDGVTDPDGRVVFSNLVPGRYRLRAEHPTIPDLTSRRAAQDVVGGERARLELRFRP